MYYITVKQPPMYRQMTLDELMWGAAEQSTLKQRYKHKND